VAAKAAKATPTLTRFETETTFGYKDEAGEVVLEPSYTLAEDFQGREIAAVVDGEGWAIINSRGELIVRPFVFDNGPDPFAEGLARYVEGDKFGFFNERGEIIIKATYEFAEPFARDDVGLVSARACTSCEKVYAGEHWRMEGGEWFTISPSGERLASIKAPGR
jgi:hypothetical protein